MRQRRSKLPFNTVVQPWTAALGALGVLGFALLFGGTAAQLVICDGQCGVVLAMMSLWLVALLCVLQLIAYLFTVGDITEAQEHADGLG